MITNKAWKKVAAFAMALALMGGVIGVAGNVNNTIVASADDILDEDQGNPLGGLTIEYSITVDSNITGGTVNVDKTNAAVGDTVTATATPDDGFKFVSLTLNGQQAAVNDEGVHAFEMPSEDVVISAVFVAKAKEDFFTVDTPENGTVNVEYTDDTHSAVKVTAQPNEGYKLDKITSNGDQVAINDQNEYVIADTGSPVVISAVFVADEALPVEISNVENGTVTAELIKDGDKDVVEVKAVPAEGYVLDKVICNGAQVAVNDQGRYLIAYEGTALKISAEFIKAEEKYYTIGEIKNGKLTAEVIKEGDSIAVKVTPTADKGYKLAKVTCNGDQVAINDKNEYVIAYMGKTLNLSAEFTADKKDDASPKTGAAVGIGAVTLAAAAAALALKRRK